MCRRCPPTAALTERLRPDLVLVTCDMVAGQRAGLDYGAMWAGWHRAVTDPPRAAGILMAVTPGNHDASGYPLRYSFADRGAFFVSLDATTVGPMSAEPRQWVDAQLAASTAPVKIAFGHLSLHPATVGRETEVLADAELEAIFRRRGLTAYVSGHQHGYYPGARNGLRLVSMACLGAGPRILVGTTATSTQAMLTLEVRDGRVASLEALAAPGFTRTIARDAPRGDSLRRAARHPRRPRGLLRRGPKRRQAALRRWSSGGGVPSVRGRRRRR